MLVGFDNSTELLKIAEELKLHCDKENVQFVYASTREELPFEDSRFDLIYDRRGPTSILNHSRILRSGGTIFGIHSVEKNRVLEQIEMNGFVGCQHRQGESSRGSGSDTSQTRDHYLQS